MPLDAGGLFNTQLTDHHVEADFENAIVFRSALRAGWRPENNLGFAHTAQSADRDERVTWRGRL
jgi:hypothetical protein